jgi:hypothetical protein
MKIGCLSWANPFMWLIASIYHIWTIIIAFKVSLLSGILTLFLPILSNIYWFIKMWGENTLYCLLAIFVFIGKTIIYLLYKQES